MPKLYDLKAEWGGLEFWVREMSGTAPRRIAIYEGAYRDGGKTEDMGRDTRKESWKVHFSPEDFVTIEKLTASREPRQLRHPIWASFPARLSVTGWMRYREYIDATLSVVEAQPVKLTISSNTKSEQKRAAEADGYWSDFDDSIDDLEDPSDAVTSSVADLTTVKNDLDTQVASASEGVADWEKVDTALETFSVAADTTIGDLRNDSENLTAWAAISALYILRDYMRDYVATLRAPQVVMSEIRTKAQTDVYSLCYSLYGHYDYADQVLSENNIIDPLMIDRGTVLQVPGA